MLQELGFTPTHPLRIGVDNRATVDGAHSDKISKDSRHQAMRLAWLRDVVRSEIIAMTHVSTGKNDADIHTKILAGPAHSRIRGNLMGHAPTMPTGDSPIPGAPPVPDVLTAASSTTISKAKRGRDDLRFHDSSI